MKQKMFSCIIIGDNNLAIECGNFWLASGNIILGVLSNFKSAKIWAENNQIKHLQKLSELEKLLTPPVKIDYIFSIVNYRILPERIIDYPNFYAINYHDSLLPSYAGRHASSWAILNREKTHGITWHLMEKGVDEGGILAQSQIAIAEDETTLSLNVKCYEAARMSFFHLVPKLITNNASPYSQSLLNRTYFSIHQKFSGNGWIDWQQPARDIATLCRALHFGPYDNRFGTAKLLVNNQLFIITKCTLCETGSYPSAPPGTIIKLEKNQLRISTQTTDLDLSVIALPNQQAYIDTKFLGTTIDQPNPLDFAAVQSYSELISPFEKFWTTEIAKITPTALPYLFEKSADFSCESIVFYAKEILDTLLIDELITIIVIYLARLNGQSEVSLLLNSIESKERILGIESFFAVNLPFTIMLDFKLTFRQLLDQVSKKHQEIGQKHTFTSDISLRYPELAHVNMSQLVIFEITKDEIPKPQNVDSLHIIVNLACKTISYIYPQCFTARELQLGECIHRHLQTMLTAIDANKNITLATIPLLSQDELVQLQYWNNTTSYFPKHRCIHQFIEQQAQKTPDHLAVLFESETLSYQELDRRANALAQKLVDFGIGKEEIIGVCLERSLEMVIVLLAILKGGGAYLPLNPDYPSERLNVIIKESRIRFIITKNYLGAQFSQKAVTTIMVDDWIKIQTTPPYTKCYSQQLANVIYTSGSTGVPKGVMNTHRGLVNRIWWMQKTYTLTKNDRILHKTPFSFDVSIWELFWPLMFGATVVIARPNAHRDAYYICNLIQTQKITIVHFIPAMLQLFVNVENIKFCHTLRHVFSSGEALRKETIELFYQKIPAQLHNLYGPTEAAIDVTYWPCSHTSLAIVPIGRPIYNTKIHILDQCLQPLPIGVPGEIHIEGQGLARGYLYRKELTNEKYITLNPSKVRVYRTGDFGKYLSDGTIQWLKRIDNQIKLRGYRIELCEIEQALLNQHDWVDTAVVIVSEDSNHIQQLIAYVVLKTNLLTDLSKDSIQGYLKKQIGNTLPNYMVPDLLIIIDEMPLSINGKIDVNLLSTIKHRTVQKNKVPFCPIAKGLMQIWSNTLSLKNVGLQDNFFDLGGNSLIATQMIIQARKIFLVALSLVDLFNNPTLSKFAECIRDKEVTHSNFLKKQARPTNLPLSFSQQRLWLAAHISNEKAAYNIPLVISLTGKLHIEYLEQAFQQLIERHEILRVNFIRNEGLPEVIVNPTINCKLEIINVNLNESVSDLVNDIIHQPFNLSSDCLVRIKLLTLNQQKNILVIVFPHIITDETSLFILLRELSHYYQRSFEPTTEILPSLQMQYIDFALWQHEEIKSTHMETQLSYWQSFLKDAPTLSTFPADKPRPDFLGQAGATYSAEVTQHISEKLKIISKKYQVTIFMTLVAALKILLYRYTKQSDIVIGTPINERKQKETEGLMGCFVNVVALRTKINLYPTIEKILYHIKEMSLKAYEHSDIPLQSVVNNLETKRSYSHTPLYQVMISVQSEELNLKIPDIQHQILPAFTKTSKLDLTFYILTNRPDNGFRINIEYSTELFEESTIVKIVNDFIDILENITKENNAILCIN